MSSIENGDVISTGQKFDDWFIEHIRDMCGVYSCSISALARENTVGRVVVTFYDGPFGQGGIRVLGVSDRTGVRIRYDMVSW